MGGPLKGGPQCRMSILRNGHVPCHYFHNFNVDLKIVPCHISILRNTLWRVVYFFVYFFSHHVRNGHVAVSNLGVKSPNGGCHRDSVWSLVLLIIALVARRQGPWPTHHNPILALDYRKSTLARGSRWDYTTLPF